MWTCITLTCWDASWARGLREELKILKKQNLLNSENFCIVHHEPIVDTEEIGGLTLNALLVTVEAICNKRRLENVTPSLLANSNILIIHQAKNHNLCYWPNGIAFLPTENPNQNGSGFQTYFEYISNVCLQISQSVPPGIWVTKTDSTCFRSITKLFDWVIPSPCDALLLITKCQSKQSEYCEVVEFKEIDKAVESINLKSSEDSYDALEVYMSSGIVYLNFLVVESLLCLSSTFPLNCCTYLEEDNGGQLLQLSLYYDLLGPLWIKDMEVFLSGMNKKPPACSSNSEGLAKARLARNVLWQKLHKFELKVVPVNGVKCIDLTTLPLEQLWCEEYSFFPRLCSSSIHSFTTDPKKSAISVSSFIEPELSLKDGKKLYVMSSSIYASKLNKGLSLEGDNYLINVNVDLEQVPEFFLNDRVCMIGYWILIDNESKMGRSLFSAMDVPYLERKNPGATVFGLSWSNFLALKGIEPTDLWESEDGSGTQSLLSARLFPLAEDMQSWQDLLWLQELKQSSTGLESWRNRKRYSIEEFLKFCDPSTSLRNLRSITTAAILKTLPQWKGSYIPYIRRACAENWSCSFLSTLDKAASDGNRNDCTRALAAIADLLAYKAGFEGRLRSGPALNKDWIPAFRILENSLHDGVVALAKQRVKWMDTPERQIRAARHYERAVHILIRETVKSVRNHMISNSQTNFKRSQMGVWVQAECPARIDLSGGWSDTPPICYEAGGSVVNLAILVDGQKPIGARGMRIKEHQLVLVSEGQSDPLIITSLREVLDYSNPSLTGALLKATLVCAGIVRPDSELDLAEQLDQTLGGGLELHGWSNLPQGSGLGTSSILASALLAVIYCAMGYQFNRSQLIHAVLHVEQLLTTGGGWQDQVGGVMGGCNRGYSSPGSSLQVQVENIHLSESTAKFMNERLLLIHTGKVRLARNLLQNVIRNWYAREDGTVDCFRRLVENTEACKTALLQGNFHEFGRCIDVYWSQKRILAPGCEPEVVKLLMSEISPLVHGQSLAGAGGGGFYYGFLKNPNDRKMIEKIISTWSDQITLHQATIDQTGISLKIGDHKIQVPSQ